MFVRDLMVNLAAARAAGVGAPWYIDCAVTCDLGTSGVVGGGCHICTRTCYDTGCAFSFGCGYSLTIYEAAPATDTTAASQHLGALKAQLHQALADIEKQESALQPQTVAEVEEHEKKLQGELAKLDKRKKELAKK
jgi:hypothetical protein